MRSIFVLLTSYICLAVRAPPVIDSFELTLNAIQPKRIYVGEEKLLDNKVRIKWQNVERKPQFKHEGDGEKYFITIKSQPNEAQARWLEDKEEIRHPGYVSGASFEKMKIDGTQAPDAKSSEEEKPVKIDVIANFMGFMDQVKNDYRSWFESEKDNNREWTDFGTFGDHLKGKDKHHRVFIEVIISEDLKRAEGLSADSSNTLDSVEPVRIHVGEQKLLHDKVWVRWENAYQLPQFKHKGEAKRYIVRIKSQPNESQERWIEVKNHFRNPDSYYRQLYRNLFDQLKQRNEEPNSDHQIIINFMDKIDDNYRSWFQTSKHTDKNWKDFLTFGDHVKGEDAEHRKFIDVIVSDGAW